MLSKDDRGAVRRPRKNFDKKRRPFLNPSCLPTFTSILDCRQKNKPIDSRQVKLNYVLGRCFRILLPVVTGALVCLIWRFIPVILSEHHTQCLLQVIWQHPVHMSTLHSIHYNILNHNNITGGGGGKVSTSTTANLLT